MRFSKQREAVYSVLCQTDSHPDVAHIYAEVRKQIPDISLGTVYRNLNELCSEGRVRRLDVSSAERFDAKMHNHAHFVCTECGAVQDAAEPQVQVACDCGHVVRSEVTLYGICSQCLAANKTKGE